jgi:hypothetical protein
MANLLHPDKFKLVSYFFISHICFSKIKKSYSLSAISLTVIRLICYEPIPCNNSAANLTSFPIAGDSDRVPFLLKPQIIREFYHTFSHNARKIAKFVLSANLFGKSSSVIY